MRVGRTGWKMLLPAHAGMVPDGSLQLLEAIAVLRIAAEGRANDPGDTDFRKACVPRARCAIVGQR